MKRRQRQMTPTEIAEAKAAGLTVAMKAGPLRNGAERGHGSVWHLVPGKTWDGRKALCGAAPSIQWSSWRPDGQQATCPRCLKLNTQG